MDSKPHPENPGRLNRKRSTASEVLSVRRWTSGSHLAVQAGGHGLRDADLLRPSQFLELPVIPRFGEGDDGPIGDVLRIAAPPAHRPRREARVFRCPECGRDPRWR